jgi:hypothetical protein
MMVDLGQANSRRFKPFPAFDDIDDHVLPLATVSPDLSRAETWTKTSLLPSRAMKPKPFSALNHFTVPVFSTAMPEDDPFDVVALKI